MSEICGAAQVAITCGQRTMSDDREQPVGDPSGSGRKTKPSDPTRQWKGVISAITATHRLKEITKLTALEVCHGGAHGGAHGVSNEFPNGDKASSSNPQAKYTAVEVPTKQTQTNCCCFPSCFSKQKPNVESALPLRNDAEVPDATLDEGKVLKYIMVVRDALIQQLNSLGIVLTLLGAITSVAILQPPGSFDSKGNMQQQSLVACFLFFSSLSFLLACSGLIAVTVGSASLFRPWFFPELPKELQELKNIQDIYVGKSIGDVDDISYDDILTLAEIILDNVQRVRRLRMYLGLSLGLCMAAFACGAFAIVGPEKHYLYMAIGSIGGGGSLVLIVETGMTLAGPTQPPKWFKKIYQKRTSLDNRPTSKILKKIITKNRMDPQRAY